MPKVGTANITVRKGQGTGHFGDGIEPIFCTHNYTVYVNSNGMFYATMPDHLVEAAGTLHGKRSSRSPYRMQVFSKTMAGLRSKLHEIHDAYLSPVVTTKNVIRYRIQSEVMFAETPEGLIVPNGHCAKDAKWPKAERRYGDLTSTKTAMGGYSLTIGARADTQTTKRYGNGAVTTTYDRYWGDEDHLGFTHPAARLNQWSGWKLPWSHQQIPYSDDAAIFFYNLMHGMAVIAKRIQNNVFDKKDLMKLIDSQQKLLPTSQGED